MFPLWCLLQSSFNILVDIGYSSLTILAICDFDMWFAFALIG